MYELLEAYAHYTFVFNLFLAYCWWVIRGLLLLHQQIQKLILQYMNST